MAVPFQPRALLLDDDAFSLDWLEAMLIDRYPDLEIERRMSPEPSGEYDIYFLDADFDGVRLAGRLARSIREEHPEAVILAFSASLDEGTLKELLNAGCNGACDKKVPGDIPAMFEALDRCMEELRVRSGRKSRRFGQARLRDLLPKLFREWNVRLGQEEQR
jgi:DNA-binding NarL/FixJ family response regulator